RMVKEQSAIAKRELPAPARGIAVLVDHQSEPRRHPEPPDVHLCEHLIARVRAAMLEREPFCHFYLEEVFPRATYPALLRNLPPKELYVPLNLRKWARADGTSTRDQFFLTPDNIAKLPQESAALWRALLRAVSADGLKRALFAKLAPDLADRFQVPQ